VPLPTPTEIKALARIVDELDYYQLLHVSPGAPSRDVKAAYYASSRTFHPDANRHLEPDLLDAVERISKRITEAYCVLRNPRRRGAYDRRLDAGQGRRIQLAEAEAEGERRDSEERHGRTPQGRQYAQLAEQAAARRDYAAVVRNLQTALTFEPGNASFVARLADARGKLR
jgi:DnaJ-class molecular chaperone